jgi:serine/threonine protein kinase
VNFFYLPLYWDEYQFIIVELKVMSITPRNLCCFSYEINTFHIENFVSFFSSNSSEVLAQTKEPLPGLVVETTRDEIEKKINQVAQQELSFSSSLLNPSSSVFKTRACSLPLDKSNFDGINNESTQSLLKTSLSLLNPQSFYSRDFDQEKWLKSKIHQLKNGTLTFNEKIGSGSYGSVFSGLFKDNSTATILSVAIKVNLMVTDFKIFADSVAILKREIGFLQRFQQIDPLHLSNVVEFISQGSLGFNTLCLVEKLGNFSLYDTLKNSGFHGVTFLSVNKVALGLFKMLCTFRQPSINCVHTDLKPENIVFTKTNRGLKVTVIDFGFVQEVSSPLKPSKFLGTIYYKAPEVALALPFDHNIDTWSTACILFETFTGSELFTARDDKTLLLMIENLIGPPPKSFVEKLLDPFKYLDFDHNKKEWRFKRDERVVVDVDSIKSRFENKLSYDPLRHQNKYKDEKTFYLFYSEELLELFKDMLLSILKWEPSERATPEQLLLHPFFLKINIQKNLLESP